MDLNFIWKAAVIVIGGVLILRLAGRKSISQLTVAQTVMMVAVGSLIIQPVGDRNIWITLIITFLMVLTLIFLEYMALKYDKLESFMYGKSIAVVENGKIIKANLKKMRLTVDMLELRIRQQGISNISDLQWATIESNGQIGYMLMPAKQPATKADIQMLLSMIQETGLGAKEFKSVNIVTNETEDTDNLFQEVKTKAHRKDIPDHLK
ncbi:hypothetical protein BHU72_05795 [Desulfuribacillus stibiiarsenatis]|uniref:YetF C-terminal domain-containing protein n=1 Tax=Desulfuribacillus stibiiarsenatis TaxID=1390249 RepID=A0A1E5L537_9FIRM|nr:DUF421 domain-containing protein [Desulfuribacillus stibiiarsenatis]OEH85123.1 hypothetical protein BHU72_05795 [Desulfuribacillus stibiiarsenatis]